MGLGFRLWALGFSEQVLVLRRAFRRSLDAGRERRNARRGNERRHDKNKRVPKCENKNLNERRNAEKK
jgi:hypothetical protein